jgi:hypothetical protein
MHHLTLLPQMEMMDEGKELTRLLSNSSFHGLSTACSWHTHYSRWCRKLQGKAASMG